MDDIIERAQEYAVSAHARINQLRKYSLQPYDVHLRAVAGLVASVTADPAMVAAAWLHDVVEDTPATFDDVEREFGGDIMSLVKELTDVSRPGDGNRAARKALDREHLARGSARAKTIKLADIIDNCSDICRHDPKFGHVYLAEARSLLGVLREGDPVLYAMAGEKLTECARKIAVTPATETASVPGGTLSAHPGLAAGHGFRLFAEAFSARDILEPLRSFDCCALPALSGADSFPGRVPVIGVRDNGLVTGYVPAEEQAQPAAAVRAIEQPQIVDLEASLPEVIHVLTRFTFCFVAVDGAVVGVIGRRDIGKPVVRMWLFGIIILTEMLIVETVRRLWPDETWTQHVSAGRLAKARQLQEERVRRGLGADLLDCLQFSDKLQIALNHPPFVDGLGFPSLNAARKTVKDLESLRNNLAHGQDITGHDWPQIARLARRIQGLVAV